MRPRERVYCSTCGGTPHRDGEELAGPPGHPTLYGRLSPLGSIHKDPEVKEVIPDGPTWISTKMPDGAPRNAAWLAGLEIPVVKVVESKGFWKEKELHILGVAGVVNDLLRFYSSWRKDGNGSWKSDGVWIRDEHGIKKTNWNTTRREIKDALGDQ